MKISIVIPNYNGSVLLGKNIPRLFDVLEKYVSASKNSVEVIIVDDCSQDNSLQIIEKFIDQYKNHKVAISTHMTVINGGFAKTVNLGAGKATGQYLILLNSDAYPKDDFISASLVHFDNEKIFGVGFMDESMESDKVVLRGRGLGAWKRGFLVHRRGEVDKSSTLWVNGGSSIFRKKYWDILGGMDEIYSPFYWEDIDLSYRAQKSGYEVCFEKKSVVVHEHEKGAIAKTYTKDQVEAIAFRNQIIFSWLNASDAALVLSHFLWFPYHLIRFALRLDINFYKGLLGAFFLIPKVIQSRNRRKRLYTQSDQEVIRNI